MWRKEYRKPRAWAALAGIAGLVLCALVVSPEPPPDLLAGTVLAFLQGLAPAASSSGLIVLAMGCGMGAFLVVFGIVLRILDRARPKDEGKPSGRKPERGILVGIMILAVTFLLVPRLSIEAFRTFLPEAGASPAVPAQPASGMAALEENATRHEALDGAVGPAIPPLVPIAAALGGALLLGCGLAFILARKDRAALADAEDAIRLSRLDALAAAEAASRARRRIELGDEVRDAVVECYATMCDIVSRREGPGARDSSSLTAREFAARLSSLPGPGQAGPGVLDLTRIFEKARYSDEACGEADRAEAIEALRMIESRYADSAPGKEGT